MANKWIAEPDEVLPRQDRVTEVPGYRASINTRYPEIERDLNGLKAVLAAPNEHKGVDLEFREDGTPTIVSVTTPTRISSLKWSTEVAGLLQPAFRDKRTKWVAHSGLDADRPIIERACSVPTTLDQWECSMTSHYLANQALTKAPSKDESDDSGALGFMDLWTMASLTTDLPNWKRCRGDACDGPCPMHDPVGYCGLDSWAGLVGHLDHLKTFERYGVEHELYREVMELGELCTEMRAAGVKIDMPYVREMSKDMDAAKLALFPLVGREHQPFNPRSSEQVIKWFAANNIALKANDKKTIQTALEKQAKGLGMKFEDLENADSLPPAVEQLWKLYEYKSAGKGLDPWFGEKYVDDSDLVHSRLIWVGASTGRLASSKPNFQNIPARGFGDLVRRAVIPRDKLLQLLKADFSQLELRMCLYLAGFDPSTAGKDAFTWLVTETGDHFAKPALLSAPELYEADRAKAMRNIAKRLSHAFDYLEGFKLLRSSELSTTRVKREIEAGALRVYTKKYVPGLKEDWEFMGGIVAFTGANLAETLFGNKTWESRKMALEIQEDIYSKQFPMIRRWQIETLNDFQNRGFVKMADSSFLRVYGDPESRAKAIVAAHGQGTSARHVQRVMLRYKREGLNPILQVHDELVWEVPADSTQAQLRDLISIMQEETWRLPGYAVPVEAKYGPNWKDMAKLA